MFGNMKLGAKVSSAFVVLVLLSMIVGGVGYWGMNKLGNIADDLGKNRLVKVDSLSVISEAQTAIKSAERTLMISGLDRTLATRQFDEIKRAWDRADKAWKKYESLPITGTGKALWDKQVVSWNAWKKDHQEFLRLYEDYARSNYSPALQSALMAQGMERGYRSFVEAEKNLNEMIEYNNRQADAQMVAADSAEKIALYILFGVLAFALLFAAAMGIMFVKNINGIVSDLLSETERLVSAAIAGKLDTRGNVKKVNFEFRGIVEGINKTLDAVIGPLNVAAEYVDRISKGDIPPKITDSYNGDFNEIKNNLNQAIDAVNALVADAAMLSVAAVEGKLDTRADASKHGGDFRKIVEGVNKTLDSVIGPLNVAAEYVDRISKGDIPPKITDNYNGDFNEIKNNLNQAIDAVNALVADAAMLSVAAVEGKLDTRADATKHQGDFRKIVEGVNKTLDAVIGPLNVAAEYVDRISKGDIPPKITENYNGDFNEIKNNLNNCIDNLNGLVNEMKHMSDEHDRGDIDVMIDAAKFQGAYKVMGEGVNNMVNGHIAVKKKAMACVAEFGRGNFEAPLETFPGKKVFINQTIEQVRENLKALIADANMLVVAAVEGKLDTRADATKHQGDFRKIVEGVNKTLDSVIGPLNVAAEYVDRISKGDIPPKITDSYNGDFNEIKNNLNQAIDAVNALVADAAMLSVAAVEGKLDTRADASKHGGDFRKIVEGVNKTLDSVIGPLNVAAEYVDRISKGDIPPKITDSYNGDFNEIKNNLNNAIDNINALVIDANMLVEAAVDGKLATRADATKHGGDFRKIVEGVNKTLDAVINPLNVTAKYVDDISKGVIPPIITDNYNGDFNVIKTNLNNMVKMMSDLLAQTDIIIKGAADGDLDKRANAEMFVGGWNQLVKGVNEAITNIVNPLNVTADYVDKVAKGIIPPVITTEYKGQYNIIKENLNSLVKMMSDLLAQTDIIIKGAAAGELNKRANAEMFVGGWNQLVKGVNEAITNIVNPLNVTADYVDRISKGDIPPKITDPYSGDYNIIKNNLNQCIDAVNALVTDAGMLVTAAVEGKLATRADATKHQGDYRKIVEGVNKTLDSVIGPLNVAADYVDKISRGNMPPVITDNYNGDFNTIKNNLNRCIEAVNGLIAESVTLSRAAVEGRLQTRGKADKFEGGYREIVQGVNDTLDAVLKPIEEAADCLKEMANGNLNVEVKGNYQGDHAIIKDALNGTIDAMNDILGQVSMAVEQVSAGSREIATSSQALSQGATESASAVEEISASMQEMGSQTNQNAENATQANQLAVLARDNAEKGNGQMTQMVKAMGDINQSANNISKIIKVIDEIAFQTNLLALNAAVEAARAGKHGKGFTVVAEEVRNLAQRSAKAAKETTEMIEDSIKRTEVGTAIAENTSKALEEIVVGATKVTDLISEIAAASKEQAQGIGQINNGLGQVDQVTQQNTASAEEMASAGEELSSQSLQLKQMLAKFQLKKAAGSHLGGGYGGGYNTDHYDAGPSMRQPASRQRAEVPWGGTPAKSGRKNVRGGEVKPEEIISLDDQHFGKF